MSLISRYRIAKQFNQSVDELLYSIIAKEEAEGFVDQASRMKSIEKSNGDPFMAKSLYVKYRTQILRAELDTYLRAEAEEERARLAEEEAQRISDKKRQEWLDAEAKKEAKELRLAMSSTARMLERLRSPYIHTAAFLAALLFVMYVLEVRVP